MLARAKVVKRYWQADSVGNPKRHRYLHAKPAPEAARNPEVEDLK